jgi:hypothetical protein
MVRTRNFLINQWQFVQLSDKTSVDSPTCPARALSAEAEEPWLRNYVVPQ